MWVLIDCMLLRCEKVSEGADEPQEGEQDIS
jgi:hypothetical protein